ncbi:MAG: type I restriction-modification system subunit M N-terminal domain-containing protein [Chitinispirillaceae bacterium]|nr:type I restriction-modification system subunit M N-terminal domain-containing protein [Chitinispirillaceae bacterium]
MTLSVNKPKLDNLAGDIWKSAERLRGKFKAYEYQNVILPIIIIRRLECVLVDARRQFEKEPKAFGNKRNRMTDAHRDWIEDRYRNGWRKGYNDECVKIFDRNDFAYHKVGVVFWQFDEHDQPAVITEPYEKAFTAANIGKELKFHDSELTFRISLRCGKTEKTETLQLKPGNNVAAKLRSVMKGCDEVVAVEWTHRHYIQDDEYIPYGEDIEAFLNREIARPIIRWEERPQPGYEILPNKYFYRYQPPRPADELLAEFRKLEKQAEKMLKGLAQ